ncbi:MAG: TOBE domain-containing protein, partial [bacterium]
QPGHDFSPGAVVEAVLRPEGAEIVRDEGGGTVRGTVSRATYMGDSVEYEVVVDGVPLLVREAVPARRGIVAEGGTVSLRIFHETLHLIPS